MYDCTQEQRDTPYFSSIVRQSYGRLCHTFLPYWPIADRRVPSNDPTNSYIIFALHTHCPVKGTKLLEETATARTICIGMPSNEGMRPQSPLGVVQGAKLEITSTELRWTGEDRLILTKDRNASCHQRARPTRRNLKIFLFPASRANCVCSENSIQRTFWRNYINCWNTQVRRS